MHRITCLIVGLACFFGASAQNLVGYNASNYAGVNGIELQPASIADSRYRVDVNLGGTSFNVTNNYISVSGDVFRGPYDSSHPFNDPDFFDKYTTRRNDGDPKSVYFGNTITMPSAMVSLSPKHSVAFTWNVRNYLNIDGLSPELATLISNELDVQNLWNQRLSSQNVSVQSMSWAEYGVTYSRVLFNEGPLFFKAGGRVKLLQGLQAFYLYINDLQYNFSSDTSLSLFQTDISYGHSDNFDFSGDDIRYNFTGSASFGFDFGGVFEWRPNHEKYKYEKAEDYYAERRDQNKYKLRVGFSVTDLGRIKYKKGGESANVRANISNWDFTDLDITSVPSIDSILANTFVVTEEEGQEFGMALPTAISLQVDYRIWKDFYVNFTPFWAVKRESNENKIRELTQYNITPRWDHKWFGVFVPFTYDEFENLHYGAALRLGAVVFGTRNLTPFVSGGDVFGADFYFLTKVPIPYGAPSKRKRQQVE